MNHEDTGIGDGEILAVSDVNREARQLLEQGLGQVAVVGELSNLARPASGHLYFSLKDANAQLRCAFFRQRQRGVRFQPENGVEVIAFGKISLYEPRGDYQLIVEHLDLAGVGALQREFDRLRGKLEQEGLFDADYKQPLPPLPRRIGVITSPSGAAVRDILTTLARRFPGIPVRVYPTPVQGHEAPAGLVNAIETASLRRDCDVLIMARGGGSLEDLWAFNDEAVARAIFACPIPIVSGVGHETDTTIADFVADLRAPTPTGAAELVVPDQAAWRDRLSTLDRRLQEAWQRKLTEYQQQIDWLERALRAQSPSTQLAQRASRLELARLRARTALEQRIVTASHALDQLRATLLRHSPSAALQIRQRRLVAARSDLRHQMTQRVTLTSNRVQLAARALNSVSPLATLGRGYAIVQSAESAAVLRDAAQVAPETEIDIRLQSGTLRAITKKAKV